MKTEMLGFSNRLRKLLKDCEYTQKDVAIGTEISRSAINQYVNATNVPSIIHLMKIAKFFGVSTDYMLGLTDNPGEYTGRDDAYSSGYVDGYRNGAKDFAAEMKRRIISDVDTALSAKYGIIE